MCFVVFELFLTFPPKCVKYRLMFTNTGQPIVTRWPRCAMVRPYCLQCLGILRDP